MITLPLASPVITISMHGFSKSKRRKLDQMVSAETVDGGKLKEAATKKADESILIQIADKDLDT